MQGGEGRLEPTFYSLLFSARVRAEREPLAQKTWTKKDPLSRPGRLALLVSHGPLDSGEPSVLRASRVLDGSKEFSPPLVIVDG